MLAPPALAAPEDRRLPTDLLRPPPTCALFRVETLELNQHQTQAYIKVRKGDTINEGESQNRRREAWLYYSRLVGGLGGMPS